MSKAQIFFIHLGAPETVRLIFIIGKCFVPSRLHALMVQDMQGMRPSLGQRKTLAINSSISS